MDLNPFRKETNEIDIPDINDYDDRQQQYTTTNGHGSQNVDMNPAIDVSTEILPSPSHRRRGSSQLMIA